MEDLVAQPDGCYALCFRNINKVGDEEVKNIFQKYGNIVSIRQSSESIPWVFIRYILKEEAQSALEDLQGCKNFEIRVAKNGKKKPGIGSDQNGDREKGDYFLEYSKDSRPIKDNRRWSNFVEKPNKNKVEGVFNRRDLVEEIDSAKALFPKREMTTSRNQKTLEGRHSRGRENIDSCRRSCDSSPPRLVNKSPGNCVTDAEDSLRQSGCGPPKLVKGSEYYAQGGQANSITRGLALRAAYKEVWENHPLHSEMQLREVIMTNFKKKLSKKDIYNLCSPVKPLHVSFGMTKSHSVFCRVLVGTDDEVNQLAMLNGDEITVTTLEELLDASFL